MLFSTVLRRYTNVFVLYHVPLTAYGNRWLFSTESSFSFPSRCLYGCWSSLRTVATRRSRSSINYLSLGAPSWKASMTSGRYGFQVSSGMCLDLSILVLITDSSNCVWVRPLWVCVVQGSNFEHRGSKAQPSPNSYGCSLAGKHSILLGVSTPFGHILMKVELVTVLVAFWSSTISWSWYVICSSLWQSYYRTNLMLTLLERGQREFLGSGLGTWFFIKHIGKRLKV